MVEGTELETVKGPETCLLCKKPRRKLRQGSLTSWIFGAGACSCEMPVFSLDESGQEAVVLADEESPAAQLPKLAERYESLELLGSGGMGAVYRALDRELGLPVAIKVLHRRNLSNETVTRRFELELEAMSMLDHEGLVKVYGYGQTDDGLRCIFMEYVEGRTLSELLSGSRGYDPDRMLRIFISVCEVLAHAHENGVVHRDIKPTNIILMDDHSSVKLIDFGIAKLLNKGAFQGSSLTQTGEIFGSPLYMSPEQCHGGELDSRSDIYSLGCVMYEAFSNRNPFASENPVRTILKQLNEQPESPSRVTDRKFPAALDRVIMTCLAKSPQKRYRSVGHLLQDLRLVAEGKPPVWCIERQRQALYVKLRRTAIVLGIVMALGMALKDVPGHLSRYFVSQSLRGATTIEAWEQADRDAQSSMNGGAYEVALDRFAASRDIAETFQKTDKLVLTLKKMALLDRIMHRSSDEKKLDLRIARLSGKAPALYAKDKSRDVEVRLLKTAFDVLPASRTESNRKKLEDLVEQMRPVIGYYLRRGNAAPLEDLLTVVEPKARAVLSPQSEELASLLSDFASVYWIAGRLRNAEELTEQALAIRSQEKPSNPVLVAGSQSQLAIAVCYQGRLDEARPMLEKALAVLEKSPSRAGITLPLAQMHMGYICSLRGELKKSKGYFEDAINGMSLGTSASEYFFCLSKLVEIMRKQNSKPELEGLLNSLIASNRASDRSLDLAYTLDAMGDLYLTQWTSDPQDASERQKAIPFYLEALTLRQHLLPPEHPDVIESLRITGRALISVAGSNQKSSRAKPLYEQYLAICERTGEKRYSVYVRLLPYLSAMEDADGNEYAARAYFNRIYKMTIDAPPIEDRNFPPFFFTMSDKYLNNQGWSRLERVLERSIEHAGAKYGDTSLEYARRLARLGHFYFRRHDTGKSEKIMRSAYEIIKSLDVSGASYEERIHIGDIVADYSFLLRSIGRPESEWRRVYSDASTLMYKTR